MTGIWRKDGETWSLVGPSDYRNEEELHDRIVEAPEMLPLSGQPEIVAPYREVPLGGGSADVLAFEASGRPVIIEVKLSRNNEARRAVVAQALAYAAALHGATVEELETTILGSHLRKDGHTRLADAIEEHAVDSQSFYGNLEEHLAEGSFRIVFVLDEAPPQLVTLAGYLEVIADRITVDLVTVSAYEVNGAQILVPERIDPERALEPEQPRPRTTRWGRPSPATQGSARFREAIDEVSDEATAERLRGFADWADQLASENLWRIYTGEGKENYSLLLRLTDENVHIAGFYLPKAAPEKNYLWTWLGVARRRAPGTLPKLARTADLDESKRAGGTTEVTDELLDALTEAYREAAGT